MKVLVLHSEPDDFRAFLKKQLVGHELVWVSTPEEVEGTVEEVQPEVVFSIKHSEFPGDYHRLALKSSNLRWFHVGGSGTDHLDPWDPKQVTVTNSSGVLAPFHAERALAGLLCLSTGLKTFIEQQNQRQWRPRRFDTLQGKTLLILGYGFTGQELAKRASTLDMEIVAVRRRTESVAKHFAHRLYSPKELSSLWAEADVLSINLPLTSQTRDMIGESELSQLPEGAFLLNGSRGGIVCEKALLKGLHEGPLAGAWLDVAKEEPLPQESPLWNHPKILLTPHCADQVSDFPLRYAQLFCENFRRYVEGKSLLKVIKPREDASL